MVRYASGIVTDLCLPLIRAINGNLDTENTLATVLLFENILALLPSFNTRDLSYCLLKRYDIMPIQGGVIGRERRILLADFCEEHEDVILVEEARVEQIFVPLRGLTRSATATVISMISFLNSMKSSSRADLVKKAANVLVNQLGHDFRVNGVLQNTMQPQNKVVYSLTKAEDYTNTIFFNNTLPANFVCRGYIHICRDLLSASEEELRKALGEELQKSFLFAPLTVVHARTLSFHEDKVTVIVSSNDSRRMCRNDIVAIAKATKFILKKNFSFSSTQLAQISNMTPRVERTIDAILRYKSYRSTSVLLGIVAIAQIVIAKERNILPGTTSVKRFYRYLNLNRHINMPTIRRLVAQNRFQLRDFSIVLPRLH